MELGETAYDAVTDSSRQADFTSTSGADLHELTGANAYAGTLFPFALPPLLPVDGVTRSRARWTEPLQKVRLAAMAAAV